MTTSVMVIFTAISQSYNNIVTADMSVCVFVKLPVSMEEVMDLLNEVNQQLEDVVEVDKDQVTSSPGQPAEGHVKFPTPSPSKSVTSPSKRSVVRHGSAVSAQTHRAVYCC